jgi:glucose-6-phosphate isomerase
MPEIDPNQFSRLNAVMSNARSVPAHLESLADSLRKTTLRKLFASDHQRAAALTRSLHLGDAELLADFSKQLITGEVVDALVAEARSAGVESLRTDMVSGRAINSTEGRAVTHMAMRATSDLTAPDALRAEVNEHDQLMRTAVDAIPAGIRNVVNIGIGGSDLGPALLCDALASMRKPARDVRFVSNIDPVDLDRALEGLNPAHTMFVVCSKSFGTSETLANARRAIAWLVAGGVTQPGDHVIAVTAQPERVVSSGIPARYVLTMPESVGGRFSVSSSVSVAVALAYGYDALGEVRDGMRMMDEHFVRTPAADNIAMLLGLVWWWNSTVLGFPTVAVVPYSRVLALLPSYLQQLIMESNGKSVSRDGEAVPVSSPIVWGGLGTNAQHAFFQLLHQGTHVVPCDFIGHSMSLGSSSDDHDTLVANMFAQAQALAVGVTADEVGGDTALRAHRTTPGNRPSTTLLFSKLTPRALGALIALYEHATFVQGAMWKVNSFDQWGVELGKKLANQVAADMGSVAEDMKGTPSVEHDASTTQLLQQHRVWRSGR